MHAHPCSWLRPLCVLRCRSKACPLSATTGAWRPCSAQRPWHNLQVRAPRRGRPAAPRADPRLEAFRDAMSALETARFGEIQGPFRSVPEAAVEGEKRRPPLRNTRPPFHAPTPPPRPPRRQPWRAGRDFADDLH
jgi:hypothetical protein